MNNVPQHAWGSYDAYMSAPLPSNGLVSNHEELQAFVAAHKGRSLEYFTPDYPTTVYAFDSEGECYGEIRVWVDWGRHEQVEDWREGTKDALAGYGINQAP